MNDRTGNDPGLESLVTLLRLQGVAADPIQIKHNFSGCKIGSAEILRCAKQFNLKARVCSTNWRRLQSTPLPGIALLRDGGFLLLAKVGADKALIQRPGARPELIGQTQFEEIWTSKLILITRRASLTDLSRRFDLTWFLGAIHKYRHLLSEVLIASFFLQLFALVTPIFFQVVIDKVLVHRSLTTLDVLVFGLVAIAVFETVLGILRTYLFPTLPTGSTLNSERAFSDISSLSRSRIFKPGALATLSLASASWRISAHF